MDSQINDLENRCKQNQGASLIIDEMIRTGQAVIDEHGNVQINNNFQPAQESNIWEACSTLVKVWFGLNLVEMFEKSYSMVTFY